MKWLTGWSRPGWVRASASKARHTLSPSYCFRSTLTRHTSTRADYSNIEHGCSSTPLARRCFVRRSPGRQRPARGRTSAASIRSLLCEFALWWWEERRTDDVELYTDYRLYSTALTILDARPAVPPVSLHACVDDTSAPDYAHPSTTMPHVFQHSRLFAMHTIMKSPELLFYHSYSPINQSLGQRRNHPSHLLTWLRHRRLRHSSIRRLLYSIQIYSQSISFDFNYCNHNSRVPRWCRYLHQEIKAENRGGR